MGGTVRARTAFLLVSLVLAAAGCDGAPRGGGGPAGGPGGGGGPGGAAPAPGAGPVVLFDGGTMGGWSQAGPGGFRVEDGALRSAGGMGLLWYRVRPFRNFVLDLDWRVTAGTDNSGVFVRFPDPGADPWVAVRGGYEIQINDNPAGDPQKTGAVYGFQPAATRASRPVGEWNHFTIRAAGNEFTVRLNGVMVNRFAGTDPRRGTQGYIGLQNHDAGSSVQFRDIRLRELA
jgi:hypothetical protein